MEEELKFILSTEAEGAEEAQSRSTKAIQQVGKVFTTVRENVQRAAAETRTAMDAITKQVSSSATEMSNQYNGMSLTKLQDEFVRLEEKIRSQEQALNDAEKTFEDYSAFNAKFNGDQFNGFLDQLGEKANQAEDDLRALKVQQEQVAAAINIKTNSEQGTELLNEQLKETKKQSAQTKMGLDSVANSLYVVGQASGGAVSQVSGLIQQIRFLKQGFTETAVTAGTAAAAISAAFGIVGIVIMAITMVVNAVNKKIEEQKERIKELHEEINNLRSDNYDASGLISEYEELNNKVVKTAEDTQRMLDIRAELVETYGYTVAAVDDEGRLLAGNLALMKEQLETERELLLLKLQESEPDDENKFNQAFEDYITKAQRLEQVKKEIAARERELEETLATPAPDQNAVGFLESMIAMNKNAKRDIEDDIEDIKTKVSDSIKTIFQVMVLTAQTEGKDVPEELQIAISTALNTAITQAFEDGKALTTDEVKAFIQNMINNFNEIAANVPTSDVDIINSFINALIAGLSDTGDTKIAEDFIKSVLDNLFAGAGEEAYARAEELRQRIYEGLASQDEIAEYDALIAQIEQAINDAINHASSREEVDALYDLKKAVVLTSDEVVELSLHEKALKMTLEDAADSIRSVASAYDDLQDAMQEVGRLKAAVKAIQDYTSGVDTSAEAAKAAAEARTYLAQQYGVEEDAIDGMLPSIQDDIDLKELLAQTEYTLALASAYAAKAQIIAMVTARTITVEEGGRMLVVLDKLIAKMEQLGSMSIDADGKIKLDKSYNSAIKTPSGGGSSTNKALQNQLDQIEHKAALDQITTAEEIALLEKALAKYAKTTAEKEDLTERLYSLRKQLAEDDLDYQQAIDQLTLREEIAALDAMIATYKAGTDARKDLEKQRYEAQRDLEKQEYDLKVYYGQLTLKEQEAYLKQIITSYKEGVAARIELEKQLYDVQQSIRQQQVDELTSLTDAIISALKNRYDSMRDAEKDTLQASIDAWQQWGDEQVEAIQRKINALDDLTKEENDAEVEAEKRRKVSMLEQAILYEQDAYNRRKLQEQLVAAQADLNDWLVTQQREAQKEALQDQIDAINNTVDTQTKALQGQMSAVDEVYDSMTEAQKLQAEAQKLLMASTQDDILSLLESYASDYNITGQSLGEQLVDGFTSAVGDIDLWFDSLTARFTAYQAQLASMANAAADQFYASGGGTSTTTVTESTKIISPTFQITIVGSGADGGMTPSERQEMIDDIVAAITAL